MGFEDIIDKAHLAYVRKNAALAQTSPELLLGEAEAALQTAIEYEDLLRIALWQRNLEFIEQYTEEYEPPVEILEKVSELSEAVAARVSEPVVSEVIEIEPEEGTVDEERTEVAKKADKKP